jgi:hypothetical protein
MPHQSKSGRNGESKDAVVEAGPWRTLFRLARPFRARILINPNASHAARSPPDVDTTAGDFISGASLSINFLLVKALQNRLRQALIRN